MSGTEIVLRAQDLDAARMSILHPIVQVIDGQRSPLLAESWAAVKIEPETVDTYHDFRFAPKANGLHALTAVGLGKIAAAAGIRWISEECRIEQRDRRADGHVYIAFKAVGAVRQPNGEWFLVPAHQDLDTADELEELIDTKVRKWRRESKAAPGVFPPPAVMAQIQDDAKRDILQIRDNALALVETKAQNRVIRKLMSLAQVYSTGDLAKPFAVPRLIYRPDLVDARELEGRRAASDVYGPGPAIGPGALSQDTPPARSDQPVAPDGRKGSRSGTREGSTARRSRGSGSGGSSTGEGSAGPGPSDPTVKPHPFASKVKGDITNPCLTCTYAFEWAGHKGAPVVIKGQPEQGKLT
jgi:hypothetical protein